jgi:hypothetical protein
MPDRKIKPSRPGRPAIDWEEAFCFYASVPADERCYRAVAERFGVSVRTVEKRGRAGRWQQRVAGIQAQASARVDEQLARSWAERLADIEQLIDASFIAYAQRLRTGAARVTASDFVGLVKLLLQLRGQPTERVELLASSPEWVVLRARILEAVAAVPEARIALAEVLDADSGG